MQAATAAAVSVVVSGLNAEEAHRRWHESSSIRRRRRRCRHRERERAKEEDTVGEASTTALGCRRENQSEPREELGCACSCGVVRA